MGGLFGGGGGAKDMLVPLSNYWPYPPPPPPPLPTPMLYSAKMRVNTRVVVDLHAIFDFTEIALNVDTYQVSHSAAFWVCTVCLCPFYWTLSIINREASLR